LKSALEAKRGCFLFLELLYAFEAELIKNPPGGNP
jgi:hypothetical protein